MKKAQTLIIIVMVALMAMGVGYAYWSQTLTIDVGGTIGTFKVKIDNAYVLDENGDKAHDSRDASAEVRANGKEAQLTAKKLIPGGYRDYRVVFRNLGDCPAVLAKVGFRNDSTVESWSVSKKSDVTNCVQPTENYILVRVDGGDWLRMDRPRSITMSKRLEPGKTSSIDIRVKLEGDAPLSEEEQAFRITMTPLFTQP